MASAYADWGKPAEARAIHDELLAMQTQGYVPYAVLAMSASAIGDLDAGIAFAHQSCDEREPPILLFGRTLPDWRILRADARFAEVLQRLALPPG